MTGDMAGTPGATETAALPNVLTPEQWATFRVMGPQLFESKENIKQVTALLDDLEPEKFNALQTIIDNATSALAEGYLTGQRQRDWASVFYRPSRETFGSSQQNDTAQNADSSDQEKVLDDLFKSDKPITGSQIIEIALVSVFLLVNVVSAGLAGHSDGQVKANLYGVNTLLETLFPTGESINLILNAKDAIDYEDKLKGYAAGSASLTAIARNIKSNGTFIDSRALADYSLTLVGTMSLTLITSMTYAVFAVQAARKEQWHQRQIKNIKLLIENEPSPDQKKKLRQQLYIEQAAARDCEREFKAYAASSAMLLGFMLFAFIAFSNPVVIGAFFAVAIFSLSLFKMFAANKTGADKLATMNIDTLNIWISLKESPFDEAIVAQGGSAEPLDEKQIAAREKAKDYIDALIVHLTPYIDDMSCRCPKKAEDIIKQLSALKQALFEKPESLNGILNLESNTPNTNEKSETTPPAVEAFQALKTALATSRNKYLLKEKESLTQRFDTNGSKILNNFEKLYEKKSGEKPIATLWLELKRIGRASLIPPETAAETPQSEPDSLPPGSTEVPHTDSAEQNQVTKDYIAHLIFHLQDYVEYCNQNSPTLAAEIIQALNNLRGQEGLRLEPTKTLQKNFSSNKNKHLIENLRKALKKRTNLTGNIREEANLKNKLIHKGKNIIKRRQLGLKMLANSTTNGLEQFEYVNQRLSGGENITKAFAIVHKWQDLLISIHQDKTNSLQQQETIPTMLQLRTSYMHALVGQLTPFIDHYMRRCPSKVDALVEAITQLRDCLNTNDTEPPEVTLKQAKVLEAIDRVRLSANNNFMANGAGLLNKIFYNHKSQCNKLARRLKNQCAFYQLGGNETPQGGDESAAPKQTPGQQWIAIKRFAESCPLSIFERQGDKGVQAKQVYFRQVYLRLQPMIEYLLNSEPELSIELINQLSVLKNKISNGSETVSWPELITQSKTLTKVITQVRIKQGHFYTLEKHDFSPLWQRLENVASPANEWQKIQNPVRSNNKEQAGYDEQTKAAQGAKNQYFTRIIESVTPHIQRLILDNPAQASTLISALNAFQTKTKNIDIDSTEFAEQREIYKAAFKASRGKFDRLFSSTQRRNNTFFDKQKNLKGKLTQARTEESNGTTENAAPPPGLSPSP